MNVDVRFGYNGNSNFDPNSKITNNERCETIKNSDKLDSNNLGMTFKF